MPTSSKALSSRTKTNQSFEFATYTHHFTQYYLFYLVAILAFAFITRIYRLDQPQRYIFDEVYHAVTAKLIARNDPRAYEWWNPPPEEHTAVDWLHPPLAKYTQAIFIYWWGENTLGWRLSSAFFGVLVIVVVATLAKEVFKSPEIGLLAATLASLDGLLLVQSRVAMNDIHVTFFMLLALLCFWRYLHSNLPKHLWLTGLVAGLALASKWSGLFVLVFVWGIVVMRFIFSLLRLESKKNQYSFWDAKVVSQSLTKGTSQKTLVLIILPLVVYVLSYSHMFWQGKSLFCWEAKSIQNTCYFERFSWNNKVLWEGYISHFFELHRQIWAYQTSLKATHGYQSRPWQWFLDLRPVWYHVEYQPNKIGNIYAFGNPAIAWLGVGAIVLTLWYFLKLARHPKLSDSDYGLLYITAAYFIVWLPWQLSPRIMFYYHYTPAVPLLCIILAYWLKRASSASVAGVGLIISIVFFTFVIWYPHWTGVVLPLSWVNTVYFALPNWK